MNRRHPSALDPGQGLPQLAEADNARARTYETRARWTGRTLRVEIEGWVDAATTVVGADAIGRAVAGRIAHELPEVRSLTWSARAV